MRAALEAAGYRVQVFTSPHLVHFTERVRLARGLIGDGEFVAALDECERVNAGATVTFFEFITAAAFLAFARDPADVLLLEVGLGGRLDATNVVERPVLTAIAPVSIDHAAFLGTTLAAIAAEKAGILRAGVAAVLGPQPAEALGAIAARADAIGAATVRHGPSNGGAETWSAQSGPSGMVVRVGDWRAELPLPALAGRHQIDNAGMAIACLRHLDGFEVDEAALSAGLQEVTWPGRLQRLNEGSHVRRLPAGAELWLDSGHNPAAGAALATTFADWSGNRARPLVLVAGMRRTKDARQFLAPFAALGPRVYAVPVPGEETSLSGEAMVDAASAAGLSASASANVAQALDRIAADAGGVAPRVLICGSLYLAGSVLREAGVRLS